MENARSDRLLILDGHETRKIWGLIPKLRNHLPRLSFRPCVPIARTKHPGHLGQIRWIGLVDRRIRGRAVVHLRKGQMKPGDLPSRFKSIRAQDPGRGRLVRAGQDFDHGVNAFVNKTVEQRVFWSGGTIVKNAVKGQGVGGAGPSVGKESGGVVMLDNLKAKALADSLLGGADSGLEGGDEVALA